MAEQIGPDETWEAAGAFGYTDEIADGIEARTTRFIAIGQRDVPVSAKEVLWLIEGYRRLREGKS